MIHSIEVKNFRSLKYIKQEIREFQVLIGPNASGKTTFLDTVNFISDIVKSGIDKAISDRASNFTDLTFIGGGGDIELALELNCPQDIRQKLFDKEFTMIRYELRIGLDKQTGEHAIKEESAFLLKDNAEKSPKLREEINLFPDFHEVTESILNKKYKPKHYRRLFSKKTGSNDNYYSETMEKLSGGWTPSFKFGIKKTALGNLPADDTKFPASTWLKEYLMENIQIFILDSLNIRLPSPPGQVKKFKPDGSNLPWVIDDLKKDSKSFSRWLAHIRTALPDIEDIEIIDKPEDRHKYIRVSYSNGGKIPSWLVSDGTLRMFALTIPAYIPNFQGLFLIEEPENGIHPKALETIYQSLSSIYNAQILMASHSPIILSMVKPAVVLCFAKTAEGVTDIVNGAEHPKLRNWKDNINLSDLFAGGILG
jgi:predicted ATPase